MYLPYLRGKQFELIALRELIEYHLIGDNILPIIEPVKLSSTLTKCIEQYSANKKEIAVILNPQVGNFKEEIENIKNDITIDKFFNLLKRENVISSHITNESSNDELNLMIESGIKKENIGIIHKSRDFLDIITNKFQDVKPRFNLIPDESMFRRTIRHNRILFNDRFDKKLRNTDYIHDVDEFFSDDHLFYREDGFSGFSDYSIIGSEYNESGFAPYAVAIHIVYFDEKDNLRIRHFVSDSNDDIKDPAGKFGEALSKLVKWQSSTGLETYGIGQFVEHYKNGTYPGLGTVKKLSLMHHIEIMSKFLDGVL